MRKYEVTEVRDNGNDEVTKSLLLRELIRTTDWSDEEVDQLAEMKVGEQMVVDEDIIVVRTE